MIENFNLEYQNKIIYYKIENDLLKTVSITAKDFQEIAEKKSILHSSYYTEILINDDKVCKMRC